METTNADEALPMGKLLIEKPNGEIVAIAATYHYPVGHKYEGLMKPNFWMYEGYMATIKAVSNISLEGE